MSMSIEEFDSLILDVLREVGNIGAGNAATALAKMINRKVDMKVPKVNVLDITHVPEILGGEENLIAGILFKYDGDVEGMIMLLLELPSALKLVNMLMPGFEFDEINEYVSSALSEVGNILAASYVNSLAELSKLRMNISVPSLAIDMAGALLSVPAIEFGKHSDKILIIENEFFEETAEESINSYFLLIPEFDSYNKILSSLGIQI